MKKIEITDILKYKYPENLSFNPSGSEYAYQIAYADEKKNTYKRNVWAVKGGQPMQLTSTIDASIAFWNSDRELILNRKAPGEEKSDSAELYSISLDGGEAKLFARLPLSPEKIEKVGENKYIFTAQIDINDPDAYLDDDEKRDKKKEEKKKNLEDDYDVYDQVPYWMNGAGKCNGKVTALFLFIRNPELCPEDPKSAEIRRISAPDFSVSEYKVTGKLVYFIGAKASKIPDFYTDLYVYDLKKDETKVIYDKHDTGFEALAVNEEKVFVLASDYRTYGINESPLLYEVKDKTLSKIEDYKPDYARHNSIVGDVQLGGGKGMKAAVENGQMILYTLSTIEDHTAITRIELASGKTENILELPGSIYFFDMEGDSIALAYACEDKLPEIYAVKKSGLKLSYPVNSIEDKAADKKEILTQISHHNDDLLKDVYVAKPGRIDYTSEGLSLHGWVLLPENFDSAKKYPAVLDVHGGPRCVYSELFFHEMQVWAARGFVVMYTNIKGSDGRGDDFADIRGDYGGTDFKNLMDFVDAVLETYPNIDKNKLCETGGSYGGFMTNWIVTHTDRFCCAATQRSISNWVSMTYISDIGPYFGPDQCGMNYDEWFGKLNHDVLWEHSPLKYVDNAKTPLLFLHSDEDYRCPLPEAMQMMQAMTVRGVETRMIVFHGENHELSRSGKPKHRIRRLTEITEWFEKHIG